ncbi:MAG: hypothetical protein WCK74_05085 [Gemmatimonadaceae bacterium]
MTVRLQVLLDDDELADVKATAASQRLTVAEWVRQALRRARLEEPRYATEQKLLVIREAVQGHYPTGDIEELLRDTARGRALGGDATGEP